jgi:autotransporter-associated beta strand protein
MATVLRHTAHTLRFFHSHTPRLCVVVVRLTFVIWVVLASTGSAFAASCLWTGKGDSNRWSSKGNWANCSDGVPKSKDNVEFPGGALRPVNENDIPSLILGSFTISGSGEGNTQYDISGVGITVTGVVRVAQPVPTVAADAIGSFIRAPIVMAGKGIIVGTDAVLSLTGVLSADGKAYIGKAGTGTLVLFNPQNMWTTMEVNEGTLRLGAAGVLPDAADLYLKGTVALELNGFSETIGSLTGTTAANIRLGAATLTIRQTVDSVFAGSISGTGGIVKNGSASLTFSYQPAPPAPASIDASLAVPANTYTGVTTVNDGILALNKTDSVTAIAGPVVINSGGYLRTLAVEQIADTARVTVMARGTLDISKYYETIGSLTGNGQVTVGTGRIIIGADNTSTTWSGEISGARGVAEDSPEASHRIVKVGTGDLILAGNNTPGLQTVVKDGWLVVNGRLNGTGVLVNGGRLSGMGTIFDNEVKIKAVGDSSLMVATGAVSPGHEIAGILHADVATFRTGELRIQLRGLEAGAGYSQLDLLTGLSLGEGARLAVDRGNFAPRKGSSFTVVNIGGPKVVEGTFMGLPEGGPLMVGGQRFSITYKGGQGANDVVLTAVDDPPAITYFLSEGATGSFFDEDVLIANPHDEPAPVTLTFSKENGEQVTATRTVPARSHATVRVDAIAGLESTVSSARVRSDRGTPLLVERTMFWNGDNHSGHTGSSVDQPSTQWFFAEGSQGFFDTFILVINPNTIATDVTFTYFLENERPVVKTVTLGPSTRFTVHAGQVPELMNKSFGISVEAKEPIMAERAMYFGSTPTRFWSGGHESAGVTSASTDWFLAEGATGAFFDTFVLLSNPQKTPAQVTVRYLLDTGETVTVPKTIAGNARLTTNIEAEDDVRLRNAAVSTVITSDVPIIAERSMYWPGAAKPWGEGHNSFGVVRPDTHWGLAEGRVGGPLNFHTFILLANPQSTAADVTVTFLRENAAPIVKTYTVPATSRFNIDTAGVDGLRDESFGALITVTNSVRIIVERSMYWDQGGLPFSGGTNATGISLSEKP